MFKKGQTVTFKKRGADASVKQYAGMSATVLRGGQNVSLSLAPQSEGGESQTIKVPDYILAASIKA